MLVALALLLQLLQLPPEAGIFPHEFMGTLLVKLQLLLQLLQHGGMLLDTLLVMLQLWMPLFHRLGMSVQNRDNLSDRRRLLCLLLL